MKVMLITGGNKGLGFESARRLLADGHRVYIGARDPARGQAAAKILGASFVQLDVTDDASVEAAATTIERLEGHLDVLVNNAGIIGNMVQPDKLTATMMQNVYATNVFGMVRVTHAFLFLLRKSASAVIVNISSGLGSFATVLDTSTVESKISIVDYTSSKSAVNMLTLQYAKALPEFRVNAVDPGYTATDLNHHSGPQTVTEGTDAAVKMASIGKDGPTGTLTNRHGTIGW